MFPPGATRNPLETLQKLLSSFPLFFTLFCRACMIFPISVPACGILRPKQKSQIRFIEVVVRLYLPPERFFPSSRKRFLFMTERPRCPPGRGRFQFSPRTSLLELSFLIISFVVVAFSSLVLLLLTPLIFFRPARALLPFFFHPPPSPHTFPVFFRRRNRFYLKTCPTSPLLPTVRVDGPPLPGHAEAGPYSFSPSLSGAFVRPSFSPPFVSICLSVRRQPSAVLLT